MAGRFDVEWLFTLSTVLCFSTTVFGSVPLCDSLGSTSPASAITPTYDPSATISPLQNSGWWCAKDQAAGQSLTQAVNLDSCFCIGFAVYNVSEAMTACSAYGGYLADIDNSGENNAIATLVGQAYSQQPSGPEYPLFIGLLKNGQDLEWNLACDSYVPSYTNYNQTAQQNVSLISAYLFSSDSTWTNNNDVNATGNGYVCRINRNPCYVGRCNATQTCVVLENCGFCQDPTTTEVLTTFIPAAGASNPIPYCDTSLPSGGWWCAVDYPAGKNVYPANTTDSCFCYMRNNETETSAIASCAAQGGYLTDIRSDQENNLMQQLVYIDQQTAPQVQQSCPAGWTLWNAACYNIFPYKDKWHLAEAYCWNNFQAHLVSVHSLAEYNLLRNLSAIAVQNGYKFTQWGFWTGSTDELNPGTNLWSDGTPYDYQMPVGICGTINNLMQLLGGFGLPLHWWAVSPSIPCAHLHYDDIINAVCKWTPTLLPMWIGLTKNGTAAAAWNRGCEFKPVNYTAAIPPTYKVTSSLTTTTVSNGQTLNPAGYIYNWNKTWSQQPPNTYKAVGTMCRKDRNPCGVNTCNSTSCCFNNGSCYYCAAYTTTSSTTSTSTTTSTTSTSTTSTSTTTTIPTTTTSTSTTSTTSTSTTPTTTTSTTSTTATSTMPTTTTSTSTTPTTTTSTTTTPTTTTSAIISNKSLQVC